MAYIIEQGRFFGTSPTQQIGAKLCLRPVPSGPPWSTFSQQPPPKKDRDCSPGTGLCTGLTGIKIAACKLVSVLGTARNEDSSNFRFHMQKHESAAAPCQPAGCPTSTHELRPHNSSAILHQLGNVFPGNLLSTPANRRICFIAAQQPPCAAGALRPPIGGSCTGALLAEFKALSYVQIVQNASFRHQAG